MSEIKHKTSKIKKKFNLSAEYEVFSAISILLRYTLSTVLRCNFLRLKSFRSEAEIQLRL